MKGNTWVFIFFYMFAIYLVVHAFSINSVAEFDVNSQVPDITDVEEVAFKNDGQIYDITDAELEFKKMVESTNPFLITPNHGNLTEAELAFVGHVEEEMRIPFVSDLLDLIGLVIAFIGMAFSFLTFNIANPVGLPVYLTWIPVLLVVPCWIIIIHALIPYVIKFIDAASNFIRVFKLIG